MAPKFTIRLSDLDKVVIRAIIYAIDLGSYLKCIPYKRPNTKDHESLKLQLDSWRLFLLVAALNCAHAVTQWLFFLNHVNSFGLNVPACLHLNFLAIYSVSFIFSAELTLHPEGLLQVQNQIQLMQQNFDKSWSRHPIVILVVGAVGSFLLIVPLMCIGLHVFDSTLPMFVVTSFLNFGDVEIRFPVLKALKYVLVVTLESFLLFYSVLTIMAASQTCAITTVALNMWMKELRERIQGARRITFRTWETYIELFGKIRIFSILANCLWSSIIVPGTTVLIVLLTVGSLYCTLRLHGHLHPLVYAFFPVLAVFMLAGVLFGVFGQLSAVNRSAHDCLQIVSNEGANLRRVWMWNGDHKSSKAYVCEKVKTLRAFGVESGSFGFIQLSTQVAMLGQIIDYLILLLSF